MEAPENYVEYFREDVTDLLKQFGMLLIHYEKRDVESVREAERAYLESITEDEKDPIFALTCAWKVHTQCGPAWMDDPNTMREVLALSASPEWEVCELYLVAGLVFTRAAGALIDEHAEGIHPAAALLYADAVDALATWTHLRGFDRCRNPDTKLGRAARAAAEAERRATRQETARRGGLARAPEKRAARAAAFDLWNDHEERTRLGLWTVERFAMEACRRWEVKFDTVRKWCAAFEKERRNRQVRTN